MPAQDTAAFGAIAERFRRAGALDKAVSLCREGLKKFPGHISARVTLGWSLLDLGKYDEARAELEQVLRRAPDNLAAIRGLAELHDRFEHTLNLPMDGPGQWPPPPESVGEPAGDDPAAGFTAEENGDEAALSLSDEPGMSEAATFAGEDAVAIAPAELGLALFTQTDTAPTPPATSRQTLPVVPPHAAASGSGMSSVREFDPATFGDAAAPAAPSELGVSDDVLAALIAEADSLEAALDATAVSGAPPAETDPLPDLDLTALGPDSSDADLPLALEAAAADLDAAPVQVESAIDLGTGTIELDAVESELEDAARALDAEPQMTAETSVHTEASAEPSATGRIDAVAASVDPEPVALADTEPEPAASPVALAAVAPEAVAAAPTPLAAAEADVPASPAALADVETQAVAAAAPLATAEADPVAAPAAHADALDVPTAPATEFAPVSAENSQVTVAAVPVETHAAAHVELAPEEDAVVVPFVPAARRDVVALERFLTKVHGRRKQLMSESVA